MSRAYRIDIHGHAFLNDEKEKEVWEKVFNILAYPEGVNDPDMVYSNETADWSLKVKSDSSSGQCRFSFSVIRNFTGGYSEADFDSDVKAAMPILVERFKLGRPRYVCVSATYLDDGPDVAIEFDA
jgi:hypothetical protein